MRLKKYGVILEEGQSWQPEGWMGEWDAIFRTALAAIAYNDFDLLAKCIELLNEGIRWPRELSKPSTRLTRDPIIMTACASYLMLGNISTIPDPVWWMDRPHFKAWRRYLITGKEKYKRRYERRAILGLRLLKYKVYARHLEAWMAYVADSDKVKGNITFNKKRYKEYFVPWNYLLNALCGIQFISNYTPKIRYAWSMETEEFYKTPEYSGPYEIDKDILNYILNKNPQ